MLHNFDDEVQALHEGVDSDAKHSIGGRAVLYLQCLVLVGCRIRTRTRIAARRGDSKDSAHKRGQFFVDLEGLQGDGSETSSRKGNLDSSARAND